jgi:hypothetical protein
LVNDYRRIDGPDLGRLQEFALEPQADEVLPIFCHGGWERGGDQRHFCNTSWGHLLVCLKDYAERGVKNPYFTDSTEHPNYFFALAWLCV